MISKADQTKKNRKVNLKKLSSIELRLFKEFIFDISNGMCQCGCDRPLSTYHHGYFGAGGRDDRYLGAISSDCHYIIHHGTDTVKANSLRLLFKSIGKDNYRRYINSFYI